MIKSFLISISFSTLLFSSQQVLLVIADNFNVSKAKLFCYEDGEVVYKDIEVNLGKKGLAWGIGIREIPHNKSEPVKYEGDKKTPAGIFKLTDTFGYDFRIQTKMPYLHSDSNLICVDDINSPFYNQIIEAKGNEKSFEYMKRHDQQYKYGIVVGHNPLALQERGSCIFLHIQKKKNSPTVGCTSMQEHDLKKIIKWLDRKKNPILIQIPQKYLKEIRSLIKQE